MFATAVPTCIQVSKLVATEVSMTQEISGLLLHLSTCEPLPDLQAGLVSSRVASMLSPCLPCCSQLLTHQLPNSSLQPPLQLSLVRSPASPSVEASEEASVGQALQGQHDFGPVLCTLSCVLLPAGKSTGGGLVGELGHSMLQSCPVVVASVSCVPPSIEGAEQSGVSQLG